LFRSFEFVAFDCLTRDSLRAFVELSRLFLHLMASQLWDLIGPRLISSPMELGISKRCHEEKFPFDRSNPLNGLIAPLTAKCSGNVHDCEL
jgi:hypothetical protein